VIREFLEKLNRLKEARLGCSLTLETKHEDSLLAHKIMTATTYIKELRVAIRYLHGAEATHVESVPVKEMFQGKTVWEGVVEVFDLHGHPAASRVYAWAHATDDKKQQKRHVTVLHIPPVVSPETAVRWAIVQQYREIN
jgi:hypothetical protein